MNFVSLPAKTYKNLYARASKDIKIEDWGALNPIEPERGFYYLGLRGG